LDGKSHPSHHITVVFDADNPEEAELLRGFERGFGEKHCLLEYLAPPRILALHVLPGRALDYQKARVRA
jgi:hypothetical protein